MIPPNPLQRLHDLDPASPQFHKQLSNFLRGGEYRNAFTDLQSEDLTWLVEHLDRVSLQTTLLLHTQCRRRSSPVYPILQISHSRNLSTSLEECAVLGGVLPKSWTLSDSLLDIGLLPAPGHAHEGALCGSKVHIGCAQKETRGRSKRRVLHATFFPFPSANENCRHFAKWP